MNSLLVFAVDVNRIAAAMMIFVASTNAPGNGFLPLMSGTTISNLPRRVPQGELPAETGGPNRDTVLLAQQETEDFR